VLVEPFCGGSHGQLVEWLRTTLQARHGGVRVVTCTLPAKKWHWKLRTSAWWAAQALPPLPPAPAPAALTLFVSSMCPLAELLGLRPDLVRAHKVLYFHENQLAYPTRIVVPQQHQPPKRLRPDGGGGGGVGAVATGGAGSESGGAPPPAEPATPALAATTVAVAEGATDFQFGWAQAMSAAVADVVLWNSAYNAESFLDALPRAMSVIPDRALRPTTLPAAIAAKSRIAPFPVAPPPPPAIAASLTTPRTGRLRVLWNHRWEYDKAPEVFFRTLDGLAAKRQDYEVVLLGEAFAEAPPEFTAGVAALRAAGRLAHVGCLPSKEAYWAAAASCDVVVSTAVHEFFGVSVVEAIAAGCYPLLPARLSYPEIVAPTAEEAAASGVDAPPPSLAPIVATSHTRAGSAGAAPPRHARTDTRDSPHLYKNERALLQALYAMAHDPTGVRAWRASDACRTMALHRFLDSDHLAALYATQLRLPAPTTATTDVV